jgi:hypothetical protein
VSTSPKGSLELVGEFLEVRTQVDRDSATVSRVDRRLGLIKNLGRHRWQMPLTEVSSSEVPQTSLSEVVVTEKRTQEGCSQTHRQGAEVQSGRPGAAEP